MTMKKFAHFNASTVEEAVSLLRRYNGKAHLIAGGTDLLGKMKDRILPTHPEALVNLKTVSGLDNITEDEKEWKIGLVWRTKFGTPIPWIKIKGRVRGQLFLDEDGNGTRGMDEKVYPKTRITLNRMHVYTDERGMFEFPVLDPGVYHLGLGLDMAELPSGVIPAISLPRDISLSKGDEIFIDIPLEQVGTIRGTVFDDKNKNMQKDEEDDGLSPIRIILEQNGEEIQDAFTDQQGRYILTDVTPGDYGVKIDKDYLPRRYIMTTTEVFKVSLKSKEQITDINFGAYKKPRKIIKTFFKKKK